MKDMTVECPHCGESFELNAALAARLLESERKKADAEVQRRVEAEGAEIAKRAAAATEAKFNAKLKAMEALASEKDAKLLEAQKAELALRHEREVLAQAKREVDLTVQRRVDEERKLVAAQATSEVSKEFTAKLKAVEELAAEKDAKLREAQNAELALRREREELAQAKREVDLAVRRRVDEEKRAATEQATAQVSKEYEAKLNEAQAALAINNEKLKAAEQAELGARKAKQEAEEAKCRTELDVARRLDEERAKVREQAVRERDDENRLKLGEKDKQLADLRKQIEDWRRRGDNTSPQLTGEVMELDLCDILSSAFPDDEFERVKKGQTGGDVVHIVRNRLRQPCGKILWESKRTKTWSDTWLGKLREDQRVAKADVAALTTETLPEGMRYFDAIGGVWVTAFPTIIPMASALRQGLIETANARRAAAGTDTVKDQVFHYLTGPEFCQRVRGALEPIIQMREEHESEKRVTIRRWNARDKLHERFMNNMAGMYGDLQGLVGPGLPDVEGLMSLESFESSEAALPSPGKPNLGLASVLAEDTAAATPSAFTQKPKSALEGLNLAALFAADEDK
jgi:hypothetical protein